MSTATSDAFTIPKSAVRQIGLAIVAVVVLVILALVIAGAARLLQPHDSLASAINSREYQAVFLSNGQVYFGKLTAPGTDFYYLTHVYYLSSQVSPQGKGAAHQTLVKLGNEIHGPEDLMVINRSQILFVENLKPSGEVSQAIKRATGGP